MGANCRQYKLNSLPTGCIAAGTAYTDTVSHVNTGAHAIADPFDLQWHMGGNNSKEQTNHDDCLAGFNAIVKLHA
jgi:hypothetical protein